MSKSANNRFKKAKERMNDVNSILTSGSDVWFMCSEGIASDLDQLLDVMIENGEYEKNIKMINRHNDCTEMLVDKAWLIDQLCD